MTVAPIPRHATRWILAALCLCTLLTAFVPRDLWSPDEQRYGQVSREVHSGDGGLLLTLNAKPYPEKPPVFFWTVALLSWPIGEVTSTTTRLAGCLYACIAFLFLFRLVKRWWDDEEIALASTLLFATSLICLFHATRGALDLPLTAFVLIACERGSRWIRHGSAWAAVGCGLGIVGGVLLKGPLGLLLPLMCMSAEALGLRRAPGIRNAGWWLIPLVIVGLGLAWLLPALELGGEAYRGRLLGQMGSRADGSEVANVRGPLYYLPIVFGLGLPWTPHVLAGLWLLVRPNAAPQADRAAVAACLVTGLIGLVLLSIVATKREMYAIPFLPFLAAPAAYALVRGHSPWLIRWGARFGVAALMGGALLGLALPLLGTKGLVRGDPLPNPLVYDLDRLLHVLPAILVFLAGFIWAFPVRLDARRALPRAALVLALGALLMKAGLWPEANRYKSFQAVADAAISTSPEGRIMTAGPIHRDWCWNLDRTGLLKAETGAELAQFLTARDGDAAIAEEGWFEFFRDMPAEEQLAAHAELARLVPVARVRAEHRWYLVFASRRP